MESVLADFHQDKDIFCQLGMRENFNLPKLHSLIHYTAAIRCFGTTDNYNTETTERLHIDFTKDAYRASNRKDEFKQMTKWLERREKVWYHRNYSLWCTFSPSALSSDSSSTSLPNEPPPLISFYNPHRTTLLADLHITHTPRLPKWPTVSSVSLEKVHDQEKGYGASLFDAAFSRFVAAYKYPDLSHYHREWRLHELSPPFRSVPVYHKLRFFDNTYDSSETLDSVHASPRIYNKRGKLMTTSRFDTALIYVRDPNEGASSAMDGECCSPSEFFGVCSDSFQGYRSVVYAFFSHCRPLPRPLSLMMSSYCGNLLMSNGSQHFHEPLMQM
jgi:hypothetical protein